jgi:hypothetical protein
VVVRANPCGRRTLHAQAVGFAWIPDAERPI